MHPRHFGKGRMVSSNPVSECTLPAGNLCNSFHSGFCTAPLSINSAKYEQISLDFLSSKIILDK